MGSLSRGDKSPLSLDNQIRLFRGGQDLSGLVAPVSLPSGWGVLSFMELDGGHYRCQPVHLGMNPGAEMILSWMDPEAGLTTDLGLEVSNG